MLSEKLGNVEVTAVIPSKEVNPNVLRCIKSLERQTVKPKEIIVSMVDGYSGQSLGRIDGAIHAKTNLILLVDSDIVAKSTALEQLLQKKNNGDYDMIVAKMIPYPLNIFSNKVSKLECPDHSIQNGELVSVGTHFTLIERQLLLKFANELLRYPGYAGDIILSKKLRENGFKLGVAEPSVYHILDITPWREFKKRIKCGYSLAKVFHTEGEYIKELIKYFFSVLKGVGRPFSIPYRLGTFLGLLTGMGV